MSLINFIADRRESDVTRWHARRTVQRESLAEHHGRTARTTLAVCTALRQYGIALPDVAAALAMALVHDAPEVETGDTPGKVKVDHPALKEALRSVELDVIQNGLYADLPPAVAEQYRRAARRIARPADGDLEAQIVEYADKVEALLFVQAEADLGNDMATPTNDPARTTQAALARLRWPWLLRLRALEPGLP
jgi:5'-deoxynucleotidase